MKRGQEYMGRYVRIDTGVIDISSPIYQLYRYLDCQYVSIRNIDTCGAVSPSLDWTLFRRPLARVRKPNERARGNERVASRSFIGASHSRPKDSKKWWG